MPVSFLAGLSRAEPARLGRLVKPVVWWPPKPRGTPMPTDVRAESRRQFLRFLAESPLICGLGGLGGLGGTLAATTALAQDDSVLSGSLAFNDVITSPAQALNVWDFENALRSRLNPGHFAYMAQGSDDLGTIGANRAGFGKIGLRPRRLVNIPSVDLAVDVFGQRLSSPIF